MVTMTPITESASREPATAGRVLVVDDYADNAQYWLAETHYVRRQFKEALPEFTKVTTQYPQSAKMPDALLKIGYCQGELGDKAAARTSLQQVMRQFPDTTAARLASQRLEQLSQ